MKSSSSSAPADATVRLSRRSILALGAALLGGCSTPLMRGQTPDIETAIEEEIRNPTVGDFAGAWGMNYVALESVGLVTGLPNTGSDPPPSVERNLLISEMQSHEVNKPNDILASATTSLVLVRAFLPPGVQKHENFDVEVRLPSRSETTSLRDGWLMKSRLRQVAMMGGGVHTGSVEGIAEGEVLVDAAFEGAPEQRHEKRGRILGGGFSHTVRKLGLGIRRQDKSVRTSIAIAKAVSARFHTFDHGVKKGVAKPTRDNFIDLAVTPRYRNNLARYIRVVRAIKLSETPKARIERLALLQGKLLNPPSASLAAIELEAIGKDGIEALKTGLQASDPEVRFYAAEALAYQDISDAAAALGESAARSHSLRWHALSALTVMDHVSAYEMLNELLHVESVECRYGAFRAMWTRNPQDPMVRGEVLGKKFSYHVIGTTGESLVHIARSRRPEIVLFGTDVRLQPGAVLLIGKNYVVRSEVDQQYKVLKLVPGEDNPAEYCTNQVDQIVRALVKLGGGYAEVVNFFRVAKQQNVLQARLAFEAMASPNRKFVRGEDSSPTEPAADDAPPANPLSPDEIVPEEGFLPASTEEEELEFVEHRATTPESGIFRDQLSRQPAKSDKRDQKSLDTYIHPDYQEKPKDGIWSKMTSWWK